MRDIQVVSYPFRSRSCGRRPHFHEDVWTWFHTAPLDLWEGLGGTHLLSCVHRCLSQEPSQTSAIKTDRNEEKNLHVTRYNTPFLGTVEVTYTNMLGPRDVQMNWNVRMNWNVWVSETTLFVYKGEHFPFNAQQNIYEYHYLWVFQW